MVSSMDATLGPSVNRRSTAAGADGLRPDVVPRPPGRRIPGERWVYPPDGPKIHLRDVRLAGPGDPAQHGRGPPSGATPTTHHHGRSALSDQVRSAPGGRSTAVSAAPRGGTDTP